MLKEELKLNERYTLKNRLILPPMASRTADSLGNVTDKTIEYYSNLNIDKLNGIVIVEHSYIDKVGKAHEYQLGVDTLDKLDGLKRLNETIKSTNSLSILQISHAGQAASKDITGSCTVGVSNVKFGIRNYPDRILEEDEIEDIIEKFINSSHIAYLAGFDGVEIHCAHGYLLNQFYSRYSNKRTDRFGGSLENRLYIPLKVVTKIKEMHPDLIVSIRFGAMDYFEDSLSRIDEAVEASKLLEKHGYDILDVSGGLSGYICKSRLDIEGYFYDVCEKIKEKVKIPVVLTGGFKSISKMEEALTKGYCDLIGVGRMQLNDPHYLKEYMKK